ncbi:MAG: hypothetical protein FJW34_06040 [Acidobacteria bacterium]|nr:hypothetical protein [Acidobacteriota bacterium]
MNAKEIERLLAEATRGGETNVAKVLEEVLKGFDSGLAQGLEQLAGETGQLRTASQQRAAAAAQGTWAVWQNTAAQVSAERSSTLASVGSTIWRRLGSGLTLSPLWAGLARLFGGGKADTPAPLTQYVAPPAIRFEGEIARPGGVERATWEWEQLWRRPAEARSEPQITVQVQAMDSQSFLDHSEQIARAVREAMLNSHVLNDVVSEV